MGFVTDVVDTVVDVVEDVIDVVVDVVEDVVEFIDETIGIEIALILAGIAAVYFIALPAMMEAYAMATTMEITLVTGEVVIASVMEAGVSAYVAAISAGISALVSAIPFQTIATVHSIAALVSEDYRNMMVQVYSEISRASEALGFYPQFLALAFRNTRQLVLDASSTFGARYDLAEVWWIEEFNNYLKVFNDRAKTYENNPEALFHDLGQVLEKPAMDAKGSYMAGVIKTIDDTLKVVKASVSDIVILRDDLDRLVSDLPEVVKKEIKPHSDRIIKRLDDFIQETYGPRIEVLDGIMNIIQSRQDVAKNNMARLVNRLKKPGDYLTEIDKLPDAERESQEIKIAEVSTRVYKREVEVWSKTVAPAVKELALIAKALEVELPKPSWDVPEEGKPKRMSIGEIEPEHTWFVGDY